MACKLSAAKERAIGYVKAVPFDEIGAVDSKDFSSHHSPMFAFVV